MFNLGPFGGRLFCYPGTDKCSIWDQRGADCSVIRGPVSVQFGIRLETVSIMGKAFIWEPRLSSFGKDYVLV